MGPVHIDFKEEDLCCFKSIRIFSYSYCRVLRKPAVRQQKNKVGLNYENSTKLKIIVYLTRNTKMSMSRSISRMM